MSGPIHALGGKSSNEWCNPNQGRSQDLNMRGARKAILSQDIKCHGILSLIVAISNHSKTYLEREFIVVVFLFALKYRSITN